MFLDRVSEIHIVVDGAPLPFAVENNETFIIGAFHFLVKYYVASFTVRLANYRL